MAFRCPSHSQPNPTLSPCCSLSRPWATSTRKQPRNRMQNHTCLQRRAGVRARGKNSGYGQPKGGRKGGRNLLIIINTLIFNIFVMDCGAPTRTRTADLLITNQLLYQLSYRGTAQRFRTKNLPMQALPVRFCQKIYRAKR